MFSLDSCTVNVFDSESQSSGSQKILYLNIQGIKNKINIIESFLQNSNIYFLCIAEHWLSKDEVTLAFPASFYCASAYCRTNHIRGGSAIFVHDKFKSRELDVNQFCNELNFEASAVIIDDLKVVLVSLYHSPNGSALEFLNTLEIFIVYLKMEILQHNDWR